jgi:hypothetical protein
VTTIGSVTRISRRRLATGRDMTKGPRARRAVATGPFPAAAQAATKGMPHGERPAIALQDVAYGGLDAVRAVLPVDLCAYLHVSSGLGPQLYLRAPDLSTLDANAAFGLFGSLRDVLGDAQPGVQRLEVGGFQSVVLLSEGEVSRGLFVFGRRDEAITDEEADVIAPLCAAIGVAAHALESAVEPPVSLGGIKVIVGSAPSGATTAEVLVPVGPDMRRATAEGSTSLDAAASATLAALAALEPDLTLAGVAPVLVNGYEAVVVVVRDADQQTVAGIALTGSLDPAEAAALAAADAVCNSQE